MSSMLSLCLQLHVILSVVQTFHSVSETRLGRGEVQLYPVGPMEIGRTQQRAGMHFSDCRSIGDVIESKVGVVYEVCLLIGLLHCEKFY